jgi:hypothetical protein
MVALTTSTYYEKAFTINFVAVMLQLILLVR